jgi:VanZ family protein
LEGLGLDLTHLNGRLRGFIVVAAWASVASVVYATLSKLELIYRLYYFLAPFLNYPSMRTYGTIEHLAAYGFVGMLFCALYPRSFLRVCLFLFLFIVGLEVLQTFTPDRHGTLRDAIEKMIGGVSGAVLMTAALSWKRNRRVRPTGESG